MRTIRSYLVALCVLIGAAGSAQAWVSINIDLFPELVPVPGYPVYYAPRMDLNYFFYDGMYWLYEDDEWYVSEWYNGPWDYVDPEFVPVYVLRIPVRYYRRPPPYFREWRPDAPPRWGYYWGGDWERHHSGWDHWDRQRTPALAPLPVYQRQYSGERYPRAEEQREIRSSNYHYQPRDSKVREHYQQPIERASEPQRDNRSEHQQRAQPENGVRYAPSPQDNRERSAPPQQQYPQQQQQRERYENRNSDRERFPHQQQAPVREQQAPEQHREREINSPRNGPSAAPGHGREQDKGRDDDHRQGEGRDK